MERLPLVPTVSEYHAIIVPIVVASSLVFGGMLRDFLIGEERWYLFVLCLLIAIAFWNGIRPGKTRPKDRVGTVGALLLVQMFVGLILGAQGIESHSPIDQLIGGLMLTIAVYRLILMKLDAIDESYFEDIELSTKGVFAMIGVGIVLAFLSIVFFVPDLISISIAFLVADALTRFRKRTSAISTDHTA